MHSQQLPLSDIQHRPYLQQRTPSLVEDKHDLNRLNANLTDTIEGIKSDLHNEQVIRIPLEVHEVNGEYLLVDGHHRYAAATDYCKESKQDSSSYLVPVNITATSTLEAAIAASFNINLDHGVGLTTKERTHASFRRYVWTRSVPKQSEIRKSTGCAKGTASNIANAAQWCIDLLNTSKAITTTPLELKAFMTDEMTGLGINTNKLDGYGLPTYSLLRKALRGDSSAMPDDSYNEREAHIQLVRQELELLESKYGVECLREGLRKHKTAAYGITIKHHTLWIKEPTTAALLAAQPTPDSDDF
jgi:hypothetical protein